MLPREIPLYDELTTDEIRHVFVEVANGRGGHGDFLKSFAEAVARADDDNMRILSVTAARLAIKYHLWKYLDNYEGTPYYRHPEEPPR